MSDESAPGVLPDISGFPGDLYFRHERYTAAHWPTHAHAWGQLNYLSRGVMHIEIDGERYLSPAQYALWIPPYTEHVSYAHGETIYRSVYVSLECSAHMPARACIVNVGAVLRAILDDLAARNIRTPETDADRHLAQVVLDKILDADNHVQHYLPHAASAELNRVLASLHDCPGDRRTTAEIAAAVHMTVRTLERKCQRELGMSLNDWRQRLKLTCAIERLAAGDTVQHIANTLGYGTSSAFIAMFRRVVGTTPEQYRKKAGE